MYATAAKPAPFFVMLAAAVMRQPSEIGISL
jgi:hypothetical protein